MADRLIRAIAADAAIKITAVDTKDMAERARQIHKTLPVATAALGRVLSAASMMGNELKGEQGSITVQVKGNGPLGTIVVVADSEGNTRGYVHNPATDLPLREDGKLDVGGAVGRGLLMVIKDLGVGEPVSGAVALVNGEIAEDLTRYFAESEQVPSAVALGVLVDRDQSVRQAGGYIVQVMPQVTEDAVARLEQNIAKAGPVTAMLEEGKSLEDIVRKVLSGFVVEFLEERPVAYRCSCEKKRVVGALVSIGKQEIETLIAEQREIDVTCQFCDRVYQFTPKELEDILELALEK